MKTFPALLLFLCHPAYAQNYSVTGTITDIHNAPVKSAEIKIWERDSVISRTAASEGFFSFKFLRPGFYFIRVTAAGFEDYLDSFRINDNDLYLGQIHVQPIIHMLNEVSIVEKVMTMVQKDDTLEYNSGAFKVNPDADASDLVRKMPGMLLDGKLITSNGEKVIKVLVDGKPFFGTDPYASLKNLPADIIDKVQVYNEKSDQERFTGFSEENTSKTVNIVTKSGKHDGIFGKVYAGGGADNNNDTKYGAGTTLNKFFGDRRITLTTQCNNVNEQNFTAGNSNAMGSAGTATTAATGINYSDNWNKESDVAFSYSFSSMNNEIDRQLQKTYVLPADSDQIYNESNPSTGHYYSHRINLRLDYEADTFNSFLWVPAISINRSNSTTLRDGNTFTTDTFGNLKKPINSIADSNKSNAVTYSLTNSILYRHKFHKKCRTVSATINTNNNSSDGSALHTAQNLYYASPSLNDTLRQLTKQQQNVWSLSGNVTYTEPIRKMGLLKLEYNIIYTPANSSKNANDYSRTINAYTLPDSQYSGAFYSHNTAHKIGASYLLHTSSSEFSIGLNYQLTTLADKQVAPYVYILHQGFQNLLPVATFHHKFSKIKNLQCNYSTSTHIPSVSQLQNVVNNTDPLHLYLGNPFLKQPYQHNLTIRYNSTGKSAKNNFSMSFTGGYIQHYITSCTTTATHDTTIIQNIRMAAHSQLTTPANMDGYSNLNTDLSYGMPLTFIKCYLNLGFNVGFTNIPGKLNNVENDQHNTTSGIHASLSSNVSENVDFTFSSKVNVISNTNSINQRLNNEFFSESSNAMLSVIFLKSLVFSTVVSYQNNSGLTEGYNQDYVLLNISIGKKIFKRHEGDIRLSSFNLLDEQTNIQHIVTDSYIQDTRNNMLRRYFLLVFTYKVSEFKKNGPK